MRVSAVIFESVIHFHSTDMLPRGVCYGLQIAAYVVWPDHGTQQAAVWYGYRSPWLA